MISTATKASEIGNDVTGASNDMMAPNSQESSDTTSNNSNNNLTLLIPHNLVLHNPIQYRQKLSLSKNVSGHGLPLRAGAISYLEYKNMRFIINDCPSEKNLPDYICEFQRFGVTDVVRVCGPSYSTLALAAVGISVHDWPYEDGSTPPDSIISSWLALVRQRFGSCGGGSSPVIPAGGNSSPSGSPRSSSSSSQLAHLTNDDSSHSLQTTCTSSNNTPCIAVHCVAGLGRAPVLVAIALIESGMGKLDAIEYIRQKRRGAFNLRQIQYLDSYKKQPTSKGFKSTIAKIFRRSSSQSTN